MRSSAMGLEVAAPHGTTAAFSLFNDQVKKCIMAQNCWWFVRCLIPVSEDEGMIAAVKSGHINL